jgi:hypothetical protein
MSLREDYLPRAMAAWTGAVKKGARVPIRRKR